MILTWVDVHVARMLALLVAIACRDLRLGHVLLVAGLVEAAAAEVGLGRAAHGGGIRGCCREEKRRDRLRTDSLVVN
jgi:hypothetical protein